MHHGYLNCSSSWEYGVVKVPPGSRACPRLINRFIFCKTASTKFVQNRCVNHRLHFELLSVELFIRIPPPLFQKCRKQGGSSYNVVSGPSQIRLKTALEPKNAIFGVFRAPRGAPHQNFRACGAKSFCFRAIRLRCMVSQVMVSSKVSKTRGSSYNMGFSYKHSH